MSDAQNNTPIENLIEVIAVLLLEVGGYKDGATAAADATNLVASITSDDTDLAGQGLEAFRNLAIRADGASNLIFATEQDDADQSVRFVADQGEQLPEGDIAEGPQSFENLLAGIFGLAPGSVRLVNVTPEAANNEPQDGYVSTPFGLFRAA